MDGGQPVTAKGARDDRLGLFRREADNVPDVQMIWSATCFIAASLLHLGVRWDRAEGEFVGDSVSASEATLDPDAAIALLVEVPTPDGAGVGMVVAPEYVSPEPLRVHSR